MRTTLNLDDALMAEAMSLSGIDEKTQVLHEALRSLIDTSVWIDHRRRGNARLVTTLHLGTHLLAAATLTDTPPWTLDRALRRAAERLHIFGEPEV